MYDNIRQSEQLIGLLSNIMEARQEHQQYKRFKALYAFTFGSGLLLIVLILIWNVYYRGGFAWPMDNKIDKTSEARGKQFNWHPLLMTFAMLFLHGNSILIYRSRRFALKRQLKLIHAGIHIVTFVFAVVGLQAVFDFHNYTGKPNLYSLHSWIGFSTVVLFSAQLFGGFIAFLYPTLSIEIRAMILPAHTALGIGIFTLATISAITGLIEKIIFSLSSEYEHFVSEGLFANAIGLVMILFCSMVLYLVNDVYYKRNPIEDEQVNLTASGELD